MASGGVAGTVIHRVPCLVGGVWEVFRCGGDISVGGGETPSNPPLPLRKGKVRSPRCHIDRERGPIGPFMSRSFAPSHWHSLPSIGGSVVGSFGKPLVASELWEIMLAHNVH